MVSETFWLQCMMPTWYLSVEWQMFLLAPLLIYPAWKFGRKILLVVLPTLIGASCYAAYKISMENQFIVKDLQM